MQAARGSAKGLDDCGDLRTLSSLPWARHRSRGTQIRVVRVYPPTGAGACGGIATASVRSDGVDSVRGHHGGELLGERHLDTERSTKESLGDIARVTQGKGGIWWQWRSSGEGGAVVHKVRPVSIVGTAPRTARRPAPPVVGDMGCVDRVRAQDVDE